MAHGRPPYHRARSTIISCRALAAYLSADADLSVASGAAYRAIRQGSLPTASPGRRPSTSKAAQKPRRTSRAAAPSRYTDLKNLEVDTAEGAENCPRSQAADEAVGSEAGYAKITCSKAVRHGDDDMNIDRPSTASSLFLPVFYLQLRTVGRCGRTKHCQIDVHSCGGPRHGRKQPCRGNDLSPSGYRVGPPYFAD
jgi:hypothetical protein